MSCVEADHHTACGRSWITGEKLTAEPCSTLADHDPVHPVRATAKSAPESGGAEREPGAETLLDRRRVAGTQQRLRLRNGDGVRVDPDPRLDDGSELTRDASGVGHGADLATTVGDRSASARRSAMGSPPDQRRISLDHRIDVVGIGVVVALVTFAAVDDAGHPFFAGTPLSRSASQADTSSSEASAAPPWFAPL